MIQYRKGARGAPYIATSRYRFAKVRRFLDQMGVIAAIDSNFADFEDAVLYQAGLYCNVDGFVTRNIKDFRLAEHPVYSPHELCGIIQNIQP